jgi:hypothetical protein
MAKILLRRDLEERRASVLLLCGEPFFCTDSKKLYVGDGTTLGGIEIKDYKGDWNWTMVVRHTSSSLLNFSNFNRGVVAGFFLALSAMALIRLIGGAKCL